MNNKGLLIVLSGFSGAGKGTVVKSLLASHKDEYCLSISATTRNPRPGEENGREYFFKTVEEFEAMIDKNELIEYAKYVSNYYGTPKAYVESQLEAGKNVILEIEMQGALDIKKIYPDAVLIFITPPSAKELENRLRGRNTEDEATILARLSRAYDESEGLEEYDYIILNDEVEKCVERIVGVVTSEKMKTANNEELINKVKEELKAYSKGEQ
ncbi:guanylate kinase [Lachnospira sp.]|jgi:guanylate kinase|uniref:guanylate kinase n=1 Tax=Lachnospira sp. TaxID=2049031 RepID=UPI00257B9F1E|nr:guanylate kinase [Lachnospira sp.]